MCIRDRIELAERYNKELLSQVDANGKVTGSQERVNFLIDQLNQLLPNAGIHFDEMGEKVLDANNEVCLLYTSAEQGGRRRLRS